METVVRRTPGSSCTPPELVPRSLIGTGLVTWLPYRRGCHSGSDGRIDTSGHRSFIEIADEASALVQLRTGCGVLLSVARNSATGFADLLAG